jgi:hypothetical protein
MSKINYEWNEDDEEMLLNNIKCLKVFKKNMKGEDL